MKIGPPTEVKTHRDDLQRMCVARQLNNEFNEMWEEEAFNIWTLPLFLYKHYWEIIDQEKKRKVPFVPWNGKQEELIHNLKNYPYWIILKARRMGVTEILCREALKYALFLRDQNIPFISKNLRDARKTIRIMKNQHNWLLGKADFMRYPLLKDSADMMLFAHTEKDEFGNTIVKGFNNLIQAFPRGEDAVSGETATKVLLDEFALQPNTHDLFAYALPIIEGTGAHFTISSTARGLGNKHSQLYMQARDYWELHDKTQETIFKPFTMLFFDRPGRTQKHWDQFLSDTGNLNLTQQEYPRTADEAMQASSGCIFDVPALKYMLKYARGKPDIGHGKLVAERIDLGNGIFGKCIKGTIQFIPYEFGGDLKVFKAYDPTHNYAAGVDGALGVPKGDYTVCQIMDLVSGEIVAVYRKRDNPERCADEIEILCKWYSIEELPLAVVEKDGPGIAILQRLKQIYPNIYSTEKLDGYANVVDYTRLGTNTRGGTKETYLGYLQKYIYNCVKRDPDNPEKIIGRSDFGWINDPVTLEECLNYIEYESESGINKKYGADKDAKMDAEGEGSEKMHDDTVIGAMQCCIGLNHLGKQKVKEEKKVREETHLDRLFARKHKIVTIADLQMDKSGTKELMSIFQ